MNDFWALLGHVADLITVAIAARALWPRLRRFRLARLAERFLLDWFTE